MKVAVISDIHGNRLALEAVLDDIRRQKVDAIFNLGDLLSGPLEPNWVADILMDLDIPTVRGNHDRALIAEPADMGAVDRFARAQLEERHLAWLKALPPTLAMLDDVVAEMAADQTRGAHGRGDLRTAPDAPASAPTMVPGAAMKVRRS